AIWVHDNVGVGHRVFAAGGGAAVLVVLIVAYRRHRVAKSIAAMNRLNAQLEQTREHNERVRAAAAQAGDEKAAIQLAGVRALAGLADDWPAHREACIDALGAYLRSPGSPDSGRCPAPADRLKLDSARDVRHTVIGIISAHLRLSAEVSWRSLDFDFTGVVFDGGGFSGAGFSGGEGSLRGARLSSGGLRCAGAEFCGGRVSFAGTGFAGGEVSFAGAEFSGGEVSLDRARFSGGEVTFSGTRFSGSEVSFGGAKFAGGEVSFAGA